MEVCFYTGLLSPEILLTAFDHVSTSLQLAQSNSQQISEISNGSDEASTYSVSRSGLPFLGITTNSIQDIFFAVDCKGFLFVATHLPHAALFRKDFF